MYLAVKELQVSYYKKEALPFAIYPYHGKLK